MGHQCYNFITFLNDEKKFGRNMGRNIFFKLGLVILKSAINRILPEHFL
jgi:hypothetical protein